MKHMYLLMRLSTKIMSHLCLDFFARCFFAKSNTYNKFTVNNHNAGFLSSSKLVPIKEEIISVKPEQDLEPEFESIVKSESIEEEIIHVEPEQDLEPEFESTVKPESIEEEIISVEPVLDLIPVCIIPSVIDPIITSIFIPYIFPDSSRTDSLSHIYHITYSVYSLLYINIFWHNPIT